MTSSLLIPIIHHDPRETPSPWPPSHRKGGRLHVGTVAGFRSESPAGFVGICIDANTGQIVASALTGREGDDGAQVGPLLDQVAGPVASITGDGAYDQDRVYASVAERHPEAAIIVPPCSMAVPSKMAESEQTQRDHHVQVIAAHGRMAWQKASGYNRRARAETAVGRWKRVIGDGLRSHTDERRGTEV